MAYYPRPHLFVRNISTTSTRFSAAGWFNKVKEAITGKNVNSAEESLSLIEFANKVATKRRMGSFRKSIAGRSSDKQVNDALMKQEAISRYLGAIDPSGENIQNSQKQDAAKNFNCTLSDVEKILASYSWAKIAQKKIGKLKEEGKPMPKTMDEMEKLVGKKLDVSGYDKPKSGRVSKNELCPCGSNKKYKRCCGTAEKW